eukprot:scaffold3934_cov78-Skeletonema_marinoi.AAC.7
MHLQILVAKALPAWGITIHHYSKDSQEPSAQPRTKKILRLKRSAFFRARRREESRPAQEGMSHTGAHFSFMSLQLRERGIYVLRVSAADAKHQPAMKPR